MYLLAQYYRGQKGLTPDWDLSELSDFYKSVSRVNRGISRRISVASNKDANINAIVILHSLGETLPFAIESNLSELEFVFTKYFGEEAKKKP
jgi:hypothetical protein